MRVIDERARQDSPGRIKARHITVVGCGHVGLVMAAGFAKRGHMVTGLERSPKLAAMLAAGNVPASLPTGGVRELVEAAR